jgi:acetylornithine deacetylase/succinyl-diaminopimelate desuccinylase-like protein
MLSLHDRDTVLRAVDDARDEMVGFLQERVRTDTVSPPGNDYRECAQAIRKSMKSLGYDAHLVEVQPEYFQGIMRAMRLPIPKSGLPSRVNRRPLIFNWSYIWSQDKSK